MANKASFLSKSDLNELVFYEKIGIVKFKNFLLAFESFKCRIFHLKKGKNYHIPLSDRKCNLSGFYRYLLWNYSIHISSLTGFLIYFIVADRWYEYLLVFFGVVFNLYCILLQRYNYIRLKNSIRKKNQFTQERIISFILEFVPAQSQDCVQAFIEKNFDEIER